VSALGSLRGFWNGIIFVTMGIKGWKRRAMERRTINTKVSDNQPNIRDDSMLTIVDEVGRQMKILQRC
jgi:hypothetical protein